MEIEIQIVAEPIAEKISPPLSIGMNGAWLEFRGVVRDEENGEKISALAYEAYSEMAEREIRRLLKEISAKHPCLAAKVIHRTGVIPVGETAIYVGVAGKHRAEAIALLAEFMDRLKQDVPIWKRHALPANHVGDDVSSLTIPKKQLETSHVVSYKSLDEAISEIQSRCQPLPPVRVLLEESFGRVLRETVCAAEDLPPFDRSTRDGYAVLKNDGSEHFQIVDSLHAADWKPRQLKIGETVRVATGAALPGENLRVVMQENVERTGNQIRIVRREAARNVSQRGEDLRAGEILIAAGKILDAGALALLATAGNADPLVSPRVRVVHFTTGDEIVQPNQTPKPGQIRDSNSILIRGLFKKYNCELGQRHLPENFEMAKAESGKRKAEIENANVVLVSGGASVGDKDFTRELLEWLGFEIMFSQVNVRPGRPLIFGVSGNRIAFGLPGNPLSHFVCFHFAVTAALAKLTGGEPQNFLRGIMAAKLEDALNPRETLWPARLTNENGQCGLTPLRWRSSGDVTCLKAANALIRVPPNQSSVDADAEVEFLPT